MASNSETGHAVNIANFKLLIDKCSSYGVTYNPSNTALTIANMTTQWTAANTATTALNTAIAASKEPINQREILFEPLSKLVTRIVALLGSTSASAQVKKDAKGIADKIRGFGTSRKSSKSATPNGDFVSVSQQSYVQRTNFMEQLIALLKTVPDYAPNENDLKTAQLDTLLANLKTANNSLGIVLANVTQGRISRDNDLYEAESGIVDTALKAKDYVKSLYGAGSAEYDMLKGLKFTRPK